MNADPPETLNISQVADRIGISRRTLNRMIADGRFAVKPVERTRHLPRIWHVSDVDSWIAGKHE